MQTCGNCTQDGRGPREKRGDAAQCECAAQAHVVDGTRTEGTCMYGAKSTHQMLLIAEVNYGYLIDTHGRPLPFVLKATEPGML